MRPVEPPKGLTAKYFCLALLPLAVLCYLPASRSIILAFGEPVLLLARPVDPRDWLRGDFVVLDYEIASQAAALRFGGDDDGGDRSRGEIYLTLTRDNDGVGKVKEASRSRPAEGLYLQGTLGGGGTANLDLGIGAYYVPEGTGAELERAVREGKVLADVRVLGGRGVIKALKVMAAAGGEP